MTIHPVGSPEDAVSVQTDSDTFEHTFDNLSPDTQYVVTVFGISREGFVTEPVRHTFQTEEGMNCFHFLKVYSITSM